MPEKIYGDKAYSYTGKIFPKTENYYSFPDGKPALNFPIYYLISHGTVINGNLRRVFSRNTKRAHKTSLASLYKDFISDLEGNAFLAEGERQYVITEKAARILHKKECLPGDFYDILKNLQMLHNNGGATDFGKLNPVNHFELLTEVEADDPNFIGKADYFNNEVQRLSGMGLLKIIIPSNGAIAKGWMKWFREYSKTGNKTL